MRTLLVLAMVVGCADVTVPEEPEVAQRPPLPGEQDQGRHLLGAGTDDLVGGVAGSHVSAKRAPLSTPNAPGITEVRAANGGLQAYQNGTLRFSGDSQKFKDMVLATSTGSSTLLITSVLTTASGPRYVLQHVSASGSVSYCSGGGGAMVVAGYWDTTGLHHASNNALTFSCEDGVIRKCFTWGYHPPDAETSGLPIDPWTAHQACTRMARADYCSVGETHTMEQTGIVIRDLFPGAQPDYDSTSPLVPRLVSPSSNPAPPDQYWFEAAWRGGTQPVQCLAKERWASLPLDGPCPGVLDDPRTVPGAKFCEEYSTDVLASSAIVFNSSKVGQLYLNRWSNGVDELVTVRGTPGNTLRANPPFPGYKFKESVGLLMRNPPASLLLPPDPKSQLIQVDLRTLVATKDRVLSITADGFTDTYATDPTSFEGYIYVGNPELSYVELNLYQNGTDFVSATKAPSNLFKKVRSLGFIDPL